MRVHVTIDPGVLDRVGSEAILEQATTCGLEAAPNQPLLRFGILRGEIDPDRVHALRSMTGVKAVEPDEQRSIS